MVNLYVLDKDPIKAAECLTDGHIPKMFLEGLQLVFTMLQNRGVEPKGYYYKPVKQGKAIVEWLEDPVNLWWFHRYMIKMYSLMISINPKSFNYERSLTYVRLLNDPNYWFEIPQKEPVDFVFRCVKDYYLADKYNNKLLPADECVKLFKQYYSWKYDKFKMKNFRTYTGREIPEFIRSTNES